jgi:class 3 adenylate cyclase
MLQKCCEAMMQHLDAAFGRIWTLNEPEQLLELQASAGLYAHIDGPHGRVPVGKFKIGLIAEEREPHLTNDVLHDPRVGDHAWANEQGMVAFAGHPLMIESRVVGVMAMFARKPLSEFALKALASTADGIALGIHRMRVEKALKQAKDSAEKLLLNILPQLVAERLTSGQSPIADYCPEVTIMFADLYDFSRLTEGVAAAAVVNLLSGIYCRFDALMEKLGLEKIKIIGDAYMVAAGVPVPRTDHAEAIAEAALALQQEIVRHEAPNGETFSLRIGISTGPVVAGVIGTSKFSYDLWGETVNTAWQMEAYGTPGCIQTTEITYSKLRDKYVFEDRGEFYVRGKGQLKTYFLRGRKSGRS